MESTIVCENCGKTTARTSGNQKYCPECRAIITRKQRAMAERRRRERLGDEYREYERKRYASNPEPKKKLATKRYHRIKADPEAYKIHLEKGREYCHKYNQGPNWKKVFAKYNGKCATCGASDDLVIHHIDSLGSTIPKEKRNNSLNNLVLLCRSCHMKIHEPYKERENVKKLR